MHGMLRKYGSGLAGDRHDGVSFFQSDSRVLLRVMHTKGRRGLGCSWKPVQLPHLVTNQNSPPRAPLLVDLRGTTALTTPRLEYDQVQGRNASSTMLGRAHTVADHTLRDT